MNQLHELAHVRRQYGQKELNEKNIESSPIVQFKNWLNEAKQYELDPTAMVLSTVDANGHPDSRVLLLKGIEEESFIFYTNYQSIKATHLQTHPYAAILFYWSTMTRQVRIRGSIKCTTAAESDAYFYSRPIESQLSAIASPQSREISSRGVIEQDIDKLKASSSQSSIKRPLHWGGYRLYPEVIEFFQGRDNRLHDRIQFYREDNQWKHRRLAP